MSAMIAQAVPADTLNALVNQPLDWRDWLEVTYWISGIVIAASVVIVFRQVRLAKEALTATREESELRTEREAIVIAAQQSEKYAWEVVPMANSIRDELATNGLIPVYWELADNDFEPESIKARDKADEWLERYDKLKGDRAVLLMNALEAFAIYFAKGAADEEAAYTAVGPSFCGTVRMFAPLIIRCRMWSGSDEPIGPYENTIALYRTWADRNRQHNLVRQAEKAYMEASNIRVPNLAPVGTKRSKQKRRPL